MSNTTIEEKRAKIKFWLDLSGMTRQELAAKVKVHISSLNGWLSNKTIPDKRWLAIKAIFEPEQSPEEENAELVDLSTVRSVTILYPEEKHNKLEEMSKKKGFNSIAEFLIAASNDLLSKQ